VALSYYNPGVTVVSCGVSGGCLVRPNAVLALLEGRFGWGRGVAVWVFTCRWSVKERGNDLRPLVVIFWKDSAVC
jgi:hypothetical protein